MGLAALERGRAPWGRVKECRPQQGRAVREHLVAATGEGGRGWRRHRSAEVRAGLVNEIAQPAVALAFVRGGVVVAARLMVAAVRRVPDDSGVVGVRMRRVVRVQQRERGREGHPERQEDAHQPPEHLRIKSQQRYYSRPSPGSQGESVRRRPIGQRPPSPAMDDRICVSAWTFCIL